MSDVVNGMSHSMASTVSDRFFSARSSVYDEEMLEMPENYTFPSPAPSSAIFGQSHRSLRLDSLDLFPSPTDREAIDPALRSTRSNSSSLTMSDSYAALREELMAKGWVFPPKIPISIIKYAVARRELAIQTQIDQPFDIVSPEPFTSPPIHTPEFERLKAWHKIVTRTPKCLPTRNDEPRLPQVKLAFGPLGWDQVWAYEYVDIKKVFTNAGYKSWWLRHFEDHRIWCAVHSHLEMYGAEVKFPYGYDTTIPATDRTDTKKSIRIPANERVLVPFGKDVAEWARQVSFIYEHWEDGPPLPYPFNPYDRLQEPPTITIRFKNIHPEISTTTNPENKGQWTKGWLSTDELTILSGEYNTTYLNTVIDGGPRPNPIRSNATNRVRMLRFWDLEGTREEMAEWLVRQEWIRQRFRVDWNDRRGEDWLRRMIAERVYESVARVIRETPF